MNVVFGFQFWTVVTVVRFVVYLLNFNIFNNSRVTQSLINKSSLKGKVWSQTPMPWRCKVLIISRRVSGLFHFQRLPVGVLLSAGAEQIFRINSFQALDCLCVTVYLSCCRLLPFISNLLPNDEGL